MANSHVHPSRYPITVLLLIIVAIFLTVRCFYLFISDYQRFPIEKVKVESPFRFADRKTIERSIEPFIQYSFFTLPVHKLHQALGQLNGIKQVEIYRQWPNLLAIKIEEKKPVARWHGQLMTESGELLTAPSPQAFNNLPELVGQERAQKDILHTYLKLSKILSGYGFMTESLAYTMAQGWQLKLKNDMLIVLGHQQMTNRLKLFMQKLPKIKANSTESIKYADLRYRHGVAIRYASDR